MMAIGSHVDKFISELPLDNNIGKITMHNNERTSDEKVFAGIDVA